MSVNFSTIIILTLTKRQIMNTLTANLGLHKKAAILLLAASLFFCNYLKADTGRYRIMFGNNPSTEMTIGFDAYETGTQPELFYSTNPIDVNNLDNDFSQLPDTVINYHGMINCFVRLKNLLPEQVYYFAIKDNSGISEVYTFETIADHNDTRLSIIGGGDSRSNPTIRVMANEIIAKLHAHAVMFDGDFNDNGNAPSQWQSWLDHWQFSISASNRITPIIPARGNHENNNEMMVYLFDTPEKVYYAKTFANDLLQITTLNSEIAMSSASDQTTWLKEQLENNNNTWKVAQYHRPMRPHVKQKREGSVQYAYWSNLFYQYGVDAVLEGDSHTAKTTWPIIPCSGGFDCEEGFKRDDNNGTVYLGEGAFASPLRANNDVKSWTRDSGMFYQFKWIFVDKNKMEVRTVKYENDTNTSSINELSATNRFTMPDGLEIWNPVNGDVVTLNKQIENPTCILTAPCDNELIFDLNEIKLSANTTSASPIATVQFYVNGTLVGTDNISPCQIGWTPSANGVYTISAIAQDVNGLSSNFDFSVINVGLRNNIVHTASIDIGTDECTEYINKRIGFLNILGYVAVDELKLCICDPDVSLQGLRFKAINIPPYAIIESASITFNPLSGFDTASATIWCEDSSNSLPFVPNPFNLTDRPKTTNSVAWDNITLWNEFTSIADATSPDLTILIQELIQRPDWTIESPITFLINGMGERSSSSFMSLINRDTSLAPTLSIQFSIPNCVGLPCDADDPNNPETTNGRLDENCACVVKGCTDPKACNFNSEATKDDGTCIFPIKTCDDGNPLTINDRLDDECECVGDILGCTDEDACNYNPVATLEDGSCTIPGMLCSDGNQNTINDRLNVDCDCVGKPLGCKDILACNYNPEADIDDNSCTRPGMLCSDNNQNTVNDRLDSACNCVGKLLGCTDTLACNYDSEAVINNFTCEYPEIGNITFDTEGTFPIVTWDSEFEGVYVFQYRKSGEPNFRSYSTPIPFILLIGLDDCTTYEFRIQVNCQSSNNSKTSELMSYTTSECKGNKENIDISHKGALSVYPQPATDYLTIELYGNSKADVINLYNIEGKAVMHQNDINFDGMVYRTNVEHLAAGIYMVTTVKDNYTETKKVLIK